MAHPKSARNGKIEFLRFVFAVIIMLRHAKPFLATANFYKCFQGGAFAVEFFFLVSGFLMMQSIEKKRDMPCSHLGEETRNFVLRKASGVWLEVLLAWGLALALAVVAKPMNLHQMLVQVKRSFVEVFLVSMTGVVDARMVGLFWYLSAMLLCMAILYPLIRRYRDMMLNLVFPVGILLIMGYLCRNYGSLRSPEKWLGLTFKGNVRALAEIALGALCFPVSMYLKKLSLTKTARVLLTLVEDLCYILVIRYMFLSPGNRDDFTYLFVFTGAIILTFSGQSVDMVLFQNKLSTFLGKLSLYIYLCHFGFFTWMDNLFPGLRDRVQLAIYAAMSLSAALIMMALCSIIRKNWKNFCMRIRPLFLR